MDERELVRRAREGDSAAFEALVTAYETKIYNLAFRYHNRYSWPLAYVSGLLAKFA